MWSLDLAIAIATLHESPDSTKADMLREEARLALARGEISVQTYSECLALLTRAAGPFPAPTPGES
jgi:hypothetical protein